MYSVTLTQHAYWELERGLSLCSFTLSCKFGLVNQINQMLKLYAAIIISCACFHRFRIKVCLDTGMAIENIDIIFYISPFFLFFSSEHKDWTMAIAMAKNG
jgi:hypothetical protein